MSREYCNIEFFRLKSLSMREKLLAVGGAIGLTIGGTAACTPPESEFIKGTVVDMRTEPEETYIEQQTMSLSPCPEGASHLSNACAPEPYDVTVRVRDVFDHVLVLKGPEGELFDVYVWPRVEKKAVIGQSIRIDPRYGSLTDNNNQTEILSKTPVKEN